jgi:anthranilate phosphoribosyltransferase
MIMHTSMCSPELRDELEPILRQIVETAQRHADEMVTLARAVRAGTARPEELAALTGAYAVRVEHHADRIRAALVYAAVTATIRPGARG